MIHPLALVSESEVADDAAVWQFASVIRSAKIGVKSTISAYALVDAAVVGNECLISSGAQLHPGTVIGDRVFVGPGAIFCNDRWPAVSKNGFKSDALLSGRVRTVVVDDEANICAGAVILPGVTIGKGALVAAGAVVTHSVPPGKLWRRAGGWVDMRARRPERMPAAC